MAKNTKLSNDSKDSFVDYFLKNLHKLLDSDDFLTIKYGMQYSLFEDIPSEEYIKKIELSDIKAPSIHDKILKCTKNIDKLLHKIIYYFFKIKKINIDIKKLKSEKNTNADTISSEEQDIILYEKMYQKIYILRLFFSTIYKLKKWVIVIEDLFKQLNTTSEEYLNKLSNEKEYIDNIRIREKGKIALILQQMNFNICKELLPFINEYDKFLNQTKEVKNGKNKTTSN